MHRLAHAQGQVLHAYLDLHLVANPVPLRAADAVLEQVIELFDHTSSSTADEVMEATNKVVEAQREFTDVCRDDLWYLPQKWQMYRRG
ncbi:hypothetical protein [Streptomyces regalis]|uniref:Uncharacterized protein n=1 Tax=Streptomyces regalis TaxID=68262 RepID=A0A0X3UQG4_9ACTN|nr:hypothetical protein [Streptomyces regalis]KUL34745.1 hypothetical protein ADL12_20465 [Streptomyces regalis]